MCSLFYMRYYQKKKRHVFIIKEYQICVLYFICVITKTKKKRDKI